MIFVLVSQIDVFLPCLAAIQHSVLNVRVIPKVGAFNQEGLLRDYEIFANLRCELYGTGQIMAILLICRYRYNGLLDIRAGTTVITTIRRGPRYNETRNE